MSLRSTEWVWRHSPARNGARLVHLALADIARDEGASIGTIKSRLHRGRGRLAELLGGSS